MYACAKAVEANPCKCGIWTEEVRGEIRKLSLIKGK